MSTINTNVNSLNAQVNLSKSQSSLSASMQRLSSGLRINSAADDAAGLAISDRMTAQIRGMNQAVRNANDAVSLTQTADGALSSIGDNLQRMRELAVQSANDSNSASDRQALQQEVAQLQQEINRVGNTTQFNGKNLLDGSFSGQYFQVGANANQTIGLSLGNAKATNIGANSLMSGSGDVVGAGAGARMSTNVVANEDLTVTGSQGTALVNVNAGDSGATIAGAVNALTSSTGVSAETATMAVLDQLSTAGTYSFLLFGGNATGVTVSVTIGSTSDLSALATSINNYAGSTGITATASGGAVTLKSEQGYDISLTDWKQSGGTGTINATCYNAFTGVAFPGGGAAIGSNGATDSRSMGAVVRFNSADSFSVKSGVGGALFATNAANASALSSVASINIGTQTGANNALSVLDGALQNVANQRAALGAMQNRVQNTITNLQTTAQNVSAARGRITDADFASETANLSRTQVLQQAGTAMVAQANQLPQGVLSLLR